MHGAPLLLIVLTSALLALIAWGFVRARAQRQAGDIATQDDAFLLGLLALAILALGTFVTYLLATLVR